MDYFMVTDCIENNRNSWAKFWTVHIKMISHSPGWFITTYRRRNSNSCCFEKRTIHSHFKSPSIICCGRSPFCVLPCRKSFLHSPVELCRVEDLPVRREHLLFNISDSWGAHGPKVPIWYNEIWSWLTPSLFAPQTHQKGIKCVKHACHKSWICHMLYAWERSVYIYYVVWKVNVNKKTILRESGPVCVWMPNLGINRHQ